MSTPTVYIVDDDEAVRTGLSRLLRAAGIETATCPSAEAFLAQLDPQAQGCLVLDVAMPGASGIELHQELIRRQFGLPIIFLTGHGDVSTGVRAMKNGAVDFLIKPVNDDDLIAAVRLAFHKDSTARQARQETDEILSRLALLTPREHEVLAYVVSGSLNKQIAAVLGTTERTIKAHRASVMEKMEADSLAQLVRMTERIGISSKSARS